METATISILEHELTYKRIDKILAARLPEYSRSYFQFLFEKNAITINGQPCKKRSTPKAGDAVQLTLLPLPEIHGNPEDIPLSVLYEDEHLLVLNKAAGMPVHPAPGSPCGTIVNALLYRYAHFNTFDDSIRPGIVHRLDKDTTGVLLIAKTPHIQHALSKQFAERTVTKTYLAVTYGLPKEGLIDAPIGRAPNDRKKMCIREDGKRAQSKFTLIKRLEKLSLVEINLLTGRTHQIRVHAKYLNAPILGDPLYGIDHINKKYAYETQLLHAWKLTFTHPVTNVEMTITAPPHKLMEKYLVV